MSLQAYQWIYLAIMLVLASLPWLSQRCFLLLDCPKKSIWMRLLEWLILYFVAFGLGFLLEKRLMGTVHDQDWEFYIVSIFIFTVFAFPGFVYRYIR